MTLLSRDPFYRHSPFRALERARRKRLLLATANFLLLLAVPIVSMFFILFVSIFSWQTAVTLGITTLTVPIALLARYLVNQDKVDQGGTILLLYFFFIIGTNGVLIDGLFPAVAPSYAAFTVMAGMVLGPRGGYLFGFLAAISWIVLAIIIGGDSIPPVSIGEPLLTILVGVIVVAGLIMIAFLSQLATHDLRRALNDATYELVNANRHLEQASQLKSQFMASTSHELRTPLSAIIVFTDLALRNAYGPLTEKLEASLQRVLYNARRLSLLINDLLDLEKIEAGAMSIFEEPFSPTNLVETVKSTLSTQAKEKNLQLSVSISPDMPSQIIGDEQRLSQILINLTHNAVNFTDKGGVNVSILPTGRDNWKMIVQDSGPGIHRQDLNIIFDKFRQVGRPTPHGKERGTGLGLAITRNLVHLMGGDIQVKSEVGKGSTFEVTLPLKVSETA
jgi:signal transduction histidine kinase